MWSARPRRQPEGLGVLELLGELQSTDIAARGPDDPKAWYTFAEASRLDVRRP